jgi:hypothetical protein
MMPPHWLRHELNGGPGGGLTLRKQLFTTPAGTSLLTTGLWKAWGFVAVLGAVAGLLWRTSGGGPDIVSVLDGVGLVMWLAALWLWPAWQALLERQQQHFQLAAVPWLPRLHSAVQLGSGALIIALAASGILLGYDARASVASVVTADFAIFSAPLGAIVVLALALAAPALLVLSLVVLHVARALCGARVGLLVWLAVLLMANLHFAAGLAPWTLNLHLLTDLGPWTVRTTPGDFTRWCTGILQSTPQRTDYLSEVLRKVVGTPVLLLLGAIVLAVLVQRLPLRREQPVAPIWLAAMAGVAVATLRTLILTWQWVQQPAMQYPGQWQAVLWAGLLACWLVLLALPDEQSNAQRQSALEAMWLVYCVAAWVCLTLPNRLADQAGRGDVLVYCLPVAAVLLLGTALLRRIAVWRSLAPALTGAAKLALAALLLPLSAGSLPLALAICSDLGNGLLDPQGARYAAFVIAALLGLAALCWPCPPRATRSHSRRVLG